MTRCSVMLLAALAWGCGSTIKATGDTGTDTTADPSDADGIDDPLDDTMDDTSTDTDGPTDVLPDDTACTPGDAHCTLDAANLEVCRGDGSGYDTTPCPYGCLVGPPAHCAEWDVSNIPDSSLVTAGETPTGDPWPTEGDHWVDFDTTTGAVEMWSLPGWTHERTVRPETAGPGLHAESGIYFEIVSQGTGAPELGVFSFQRITIPSNYVFGVWGARPLVLISEEDFLIEGGVFAGCAWTDGPPVGGASESGTGPGAGTAGTRTPSSGGYYDGGGGGGAYGGAGGDGAGEPSTLRGLGGTACGDADLIPLVAGSGGGMGGGAGGGRWGGRSGAAVELVSGGTLTLEATGWIDAGGCGGIGAAEYEGGGGGGSGGAILVEAQGLDLSGAITANGGAGAGGGGPIDGTSGEDGQAGTALRAAGGAAGMWGCTGGPGSGDISPDGMDAPACGTGTYNWGGGGGGSGVIRINARTVDLTDCLLSPPIGTAASQGGLGVH